MLVTVRFLLPLISIPVRHAVHLSLMFNLQSCFSFSVAVSSMYLAPSFAPKSLGHCCPATAVPAAPAAALRGSSSWLLLWLLFVAALRLLFVAALRGRFWGCSSWQLLLAALRLLFVAAPAAALRGCTAAALRGCTAAALRGSSRGCSSWLLHSSFCKNPF